ncbi:hypothetical protein [Saccharopolyspora cebuensis]|uniref:MYXO-CTERM domain-containing protein n=1 Tax=Saccharopolyspora cebuensis TaxID=418759 RepID=A0ABV4CKN2_9PSEU
MSALARTVLLPAGLVAALLTTGGTAHADGPGFFGDDDVIRYDRTSSYSGPLLPPFTPTDGRELAAELAEAERAHGICFGWELHDGNTDDPPEQGSSRGPGTDAESCARWAEVRATVAWDHLSYDGAVDLVVAASPDLRPLPSVEDFTGVGVTGERLVEHPIGTTGQAAMALPLLLVETGALPPVPTPAAERGAPPRPLPEMDEAGPWGWVGGLGAFAVLAVGLGVRGRIKHRQASAPPPPPPPQQGPPQGMPPGPPPGMPPQGPWPGPPPGGPSPQGPWPGPPPGGPPQAPPPWPPPQNPPPRH